MSDDKIVIDEKHQIIGKKLLEMGELPIGPIHRYLRMANGPEEGDRIYEAERAAEVALDEQFPVQFRGTFFAGPQFLIEVLKRTGHPWACSRQTRGSYDYYGPFSFTDISVEQALSEIVPESHWDEDALAKMREVYETEEGKPS